MTEQVDVLIIGGGAAGLMCGRVAGARGRRVLILDHAKKPAEKIRISGGGRCNFTNIHSAPTAFLSGNRHFCKSAFSRYTQDDFIALVKQHGIAFHEKKLGQLFCDDSAQQIIDMLLAECASAGAELRLRTSVGGIAALPDGGYRVEASCGVVECASLVIATGGLSIPKIGATRFGYDVARQFGLEVTGLRPALVPLTFQAISSNAARRCPACRSMPRCATARPASARAALHPSRAVRPVGAADQQLLGRGRGGQHRPCSWHRYRRAADWCQGHIAEARGAERTCGASAETAGREYT